MQKEQKIPIPANQERKQSKITLHEFAVIAFIAGILIFLVLKILFF